jgi:hypothetical protein
MPLVQLLQVGGVAAADLMYQASQGKQQTNQ